MTAHAARDGDLAARVEELAAGLAALDRGVIEAGQLAAQALARLDGLPPGLAGAYRLGFEAGQRRERAASEPQPRQPRHLRLIEP